MTDQQPPTALAAAFPSPPPFYQAFTPENLERIAALRATQQADRVHSTAETQTTSGDVPVPAPSPAPALRLLDLPPELRLLQPPEPPADGIYRSFGDTFNLNEGLPSLASQGIEQLYTLPPAPSPSTSNANAGRSAHSDRALILKRLAKSLLLNFLELMGIMSVNPEQYAEKIQDLRTLFINFHHLLNEYRPHQARESLILMMEEQLERARSETAGIEAMKAKVEGILSGLGQTNGNSVEGSDEVTEKNSMPNGNTKDNEDAEVAIWEELRREFG